MLAHSITTEVVQGLKREIPPAVLQRAVLHVLDWLGCAWFGLRYPAGRSLLQHGKDTPAGKSSALGLGARDVASTVLHNGALGNLAEMDDVHRTSILHPGPVIIPAALALAEHLGSNGKDLLAAIVRGYEVTIRIGAALGRAHYAFFHNTSTAGAFGAAAACAELLGLNEQQKVWALGNAGTRTGGFWQMRHEDCMSKALHTALAAHSGWLSAQLAKRGFSGPAFILEGPQGLFQAIARDGNPADIVFGDWTDWKILEVSFKPWAACRHAHPAIDAALKLKARLAPGAQLARVRVHTYPDAIKFCDKREPKTESEAKFSLQHAVAVALVKGKPTLDDFAPPFQNDRVNALRGKVELAIDMELARAYPQHYGARIEAQLVEGGSETEQVHDAWGDPAWPLLPAEVESKAHQLMTRAGLARAQADALVQAVRELPTARSLAEFGKRLQAVGAL